MRTPAYTVYYGMVLVLLAYILINSHTSVVVCVSLFVISSMCNKHKSEDSRILFHIINYTCVREPWIIHMSLPGALVIFFNKKRTSSTSKKPLRFINVRACDTCTCILKTRFMVPLRENSYNYQLSCACDTTTTTITRTSCE